MEASRIAQQTCQARKKSVRTICAVPAAQVGPYYHWCSPDEVGRLADARCWWCKRSEQTVTHFFLECRKWRTERKTTIWKLRDKKVATTETTGRSDVKILCEDDAVDVLEFVKKAEVDRRSVGASDGAGSRVHEI